MLTFEEETHTYRVDGRRVPSVTQVLAPLFRWDLVPPETLERKRQIGNALHRAIHLELSGFTIDASTIDQSVMPFYNGWRAFRIECDYVPVLSEFRIHSLRSNYCGTLDSWGQLQGRPALIDWKTAATIDHAAVGAQTAGYLMALAEQGIGSLADGRFALQLLPNGRYKLHRYVSVFDDGARFLLLRAAFVDHEETA